MRSQKYRIAICITLVAMIALLAFALPAWASLAAPSINYVVVEKTAPSSSDITLDHLAALTSFYQNIITILLVVIGALCALSIISIRHISKVAAEDIAVEAAKKVVHDSVQFRDEVDAIVEEAMGSLLAEVDKLKADFQAIAKKVSSIDKSEDLSADEQIYTKE